MGKGKGLLCGKEGEGKDMDRGEEGKQHKDRLRYKTFPANIVNSFNKEIQFTINTCA